VLAAALAPALSVAARALADEPDEPEDAPTTAEAPKEAPKESRAEARRRVLAAMEKDATALINVSSRELPASPDLYALGRKGTRALERALADNADASIRASCASFLARIGDRGSLGPLQTALEDWEPAVRGQVVAALEAIPDKSSIDPLIKLFQRKDEDRGNRVAVLEALGAIGNKRAVDFLRKHLAKPAKGGEGDEDHAEDLRPEAFRALWRSRHVMSRETLVNDVDAALRSGHVSLVQEGVLAAAELRAPKLSKALIPLLDHPNANIRNKSVYALGLIGDKAATKALLDKLPSVRDGRMLNNIAFALERLDRTAFYASIQKVIEHKQAVIRLNAAFVLGDVKRPEGLPYLEKALSDPSDLVKTSAAAALGKIGDAKATPALERIVTSAKGPLQEEAIYALDHISGGKRGDLVFRELFPSTKAPVKLRAAENLGDHGDPRVRDFLLACVESGQCNAAEVDKFVHLDKDPANGGRLLLAWARGRSDLAKLVADLRPPGALAMVTAAMDASIAGKGKNLASTFDLVGDLGDAGTKPRLEAALGRAPSRGFWTDLHATTALARLGDRGADALLLGRIDQVAAEWLPHVAAVIRRIAEKEVRARLAPELDQRAKGKDTAIALASASILLQWDPEAAIFRFLDGLASPSVEERELAERYLVRSGEPKVTALLRRALAREERADVRDRLRGVLDRREP
jgi:HEAT repeat protein